MGFILGQVYRIQQKMGGNLCQASDATIYGLLNGFEGIIDEQFEIMGNISSEDVDRIGVILDEYFTDPNKLKELKGYYDIEPRIQGLGIDRGKALRIMRWYFLNHSFINVFEKMKGTHSPAEFNSNFRDIN